MLEYQERLAKLIAESGALFFQDGMRLKDGRPTPYFINMGVFRTGRLSSELGRCFAEWLVHEGLLGEIDAIVGPSYKGSALAQATAITLWEEHRVEVSFDYDRKEAKSHGEGTGKGLLFVTGAAQKGGRVLILDDVGTSMSTKRDLVKKLDWLSGVSEKPQKIVGVCLAVDRGQTMAVYDAQGRVRENKRGPDAIQSFIQDTGIQVWSLLGVRRAITYLFESQIEVLVNGDRRSLTSVEVEMVEAYLAVYGQEE